MLIGLLRGGVALLGCILLAFQLAHGFAGRFLLAFQNLIAQIGKSTQLAHDTGIGRILLGFGLITSNFLLLTGFLLVFGFLPSAGMRCDDATILFVEFDDLVITTKSGKTIPTMVLKFPEQLRKNYQNLLL